MRRDVAAPALVAALLVGLGAAAGGGAAHAEAPPTLARLLEGFAAMPGLRARFVEEKRLAMLSVPLRSEGELFFAPPGRLLRRVTAPTASSALLVGERLVLRSPGGREEIDLSENAVVAGFVDTFRHVLAGDRAALERLYRARFEARGGGWRLTLTPRDPGLGRFLDALVLEGEGPALTRMQMTERNGDVTTTTFSEVDPARRFTPAELARLFGAR